MVAAGMLQWAKVPTPSSTALDARQALPLTLSDIMCAATMGRSIEYGDGVAKFCSSVQQTVSAELNIVEYVVQMEACGPDNDVGVCAQPMSLAFTEAGAFADTVIQDSCVDIFNEVNQPCLSQDTGAIGGITVNTDHGAISGTIEADFQPDTLPPTETYAAVNPTYTYESGSLCSRLHDSLVQGRIGTGIDIVWGCRAVWLSLGRGVHGSRNGTLNRYIHSFANLYPLRMKRDLAI